jgi:cytochrome P450
MLASPVLYDPLDPAVIASPYAIYDVCRDASPFWHDAMGCWVAMKHGDCVTVLKDTDTYASDWRLAGMADDATPEDSLGIQSLDGVPHGRLRSSFAQAMTSVGGREGDKSRVRSLVRARLEANSCLHEPFDFVALVARPVALDVVCGVLGVRVPDESSFARMAEDLVLGMDAGLLPERANAARSAKQELNRLVAQWSDDDFAAESDGVLRRSLETAESLGITRQQVVSTARQFFLAGYSTTVAAAANVLLAISSDRALAERLQQDPRQIPRTVDELLRLDGPVQGTSRAVTSNAVLGGAAMKRGDIVLCLFGAANRDPSAFSDANAVDINRTGGRRHLGFGWGPHACTGAILARAIVQALVEEVLAAGLPAAVGDVSRIPRATLRYPDRVVLKFEQA